MATGIWTDPATGSIWRELVNGLWAQEGTGNVSAVDPSTIDSSLLTQYGTTDAQNWQSFEDFEAMQKALGFTPEQISGRWEAMQQDRASQEGSLEGFIDSALPGLVGGALFAGVGWPGLTGGEVYEGVSGTEGFASEALDPALNTFASNAGVTDVPVTEGAEMFDWEQFTPDFMQSGETFWTDTAGGAGGAFDWEQFTPDFMKSGETFWTPTSGAVGTTALSALQRLLGMSENGTGSDLMKVLGALGPGLLQAFGNYQSADAIKDLASQQKGQFDEFKSLGAPYRQRLSDLYSNPGGYLQSPDVQASVQQGTDALARSLSAKVGNPIGNMTALGELQNYSANQLFGKLGQEKDRLAGFGGLSAYNQAGAGSPLATQLSQLGIGADAGVWGGVGRAAGDLFNPAPTTFTDLLKQLQGSNIFKVV